MSGPRWLAAQRSWNAEGVMTWDWVSPSVLLVFWAVALVAGVALVLLTLRAMARVRRRARARGALAAERLAGRLLERHGYLVHASQVTRRWPVVVGDRHFEIALKADYLVTFEGEWFVAEVKNGAYVARVQHGPTRRQLLEYQLAYAVDGVLLVDVERQSIERVRFVALEQG